MDKELIEKVMKTTTKEKFSEYNSRKWGFAAC